MNNFTQLDDGPSAMRTIPAVFAVLTVACGLFLTRLDSLYVPGHSAALVFALAAPMSYSWLGRKSRLNGGTNRPLFVGLLVFAVLSALASGIMISMGSAVNASGDIGGIGMWLLSTVGLLGFSIAAGIVRPRATARA